MEMIGYSDKSVVLLTMTFFQRIVKCIINTIYYNNKVPTVPTIPQILDMNGDEWQSMFYTYEWKWGQDVLIMETISA